MNAPTKLPAIPADALVRQARLREALQAMEGASPSREPQPIQALRAMLSGGSTDDTDHWITTVLEAGLPEEAAELLRTSRRGSAVPALIESLAARVGPLAEKARQRRSAGWQLDTRRVLIRFRYRKEGNALDFDDGDLHGIFLQAFRLEGLQLALDLGKRPRPLLSAGLPLPVQVGGLEETMDAVLKREPLDEPAALTARLNQRLPDGVGIHGWEPLPSYATPVCDLALQSHWRWQVPENFRSIVQEKIAAFLAESTWPWDRCGSKGDAPLDLRAIVTELRWETGCLMVSTRMGAFNALNPLKVLGAILGLDPSRVTGLVRIGVDLKPDDRLAQGERFEPKLKNMFEDAVLLGGGSNIVLVDEDDEDPIQLG